MSNGEKLRWKLISEGTFEQIKDFLVNQAAASNQEFTSKLNLVKNYGFIPKEERFSAIPTPYDWMDVAPFSPSAAIYFMDGYSDARIKIRQSGEEIFLQFWDQNTSISASPPSVFDESQLERKNFTPVPPPLISYASFPENTPDSYKRKTNYHAMQVISMNMKAKDSDARLLIGLPYAEKYPELFFRDNLFGETRTDKDASSFGVVQSLTEFSETNGEKTAYTNGYPARSFFAIYHLIETPIGNLFNKKATQMELQPSADGKLALKLPPLPFNYSLINGPIPLYLADNPKNDAVADLIMAHHNDRAAAMDVTEDAFPWRTIDIDRIKDTINKLRSE